MRRMPEIHCLFLLRINYTFVKHLVGPFRSHFSISICINRGESKNMPSLRKLLKRKLLINYKQDPTREKQVLWEKRPKHKLQSSIPHYRQKNQSRSLRQNYHQVESWKFTRRKPKATPPHWHHTSNITFEGIHHDMDHEIHGSLVKNVRMAPLVRTGQPPLCCFYGLSYRPGLANTRQQLNRMPILWSYNLDTVTNLLK